MKKKTVVISVIALVLVVCCGFLLHYLFSGESVDKVLLQNTVSPNGQYEINVYRSEPGATVDFSVRA